MKNDSVYPLPLHVCSFAIINYAAVSKYKYAQSYWNKHTVSEKYVDNIKWVQMIYFINIGEGYLNII